MMISDEEREILRKVACDAAARAMGLRAPARPEIAADSALARPAPVFVTWRRDGRPRGRSGTTETARALAAEVEEHAVAALLHDPRFPPATAKELPRHVPEISVLSTFEEIFSSSEGICGPSSLVSGLHGVVVEKGKRRGVVLPQDATLFDWDGARILSQACLRAGLPEESWKAASPPRLLRFTADVF
jgi:AmmeMemoRadiSam system protein A